MAFNIILQMNKSDYNVLDKSLTNIATVSGRLKDSTSIIDPIILISGDISNYINCNYMTISNFNRSYFINNIISITNSLFEIHAHVDVLTSFKSEIRANNCILSRQENKYNLYLNDGSLKIYQKQLLLF